MLIVPFYSYFFIIYLNLGAMSYGLSIFVYECGNVLIAIMLWKRMVHEDTKSTVHSFSHRLTWYSCESAKNMLTVIHIFIAYECVTLIIA